MSQADCPGETCRVRKAKCDLHRLSLTRGLGWVRAYMPNVHHYMAEPIEGMARWVWKHCDAP